jgi:hypothetical protein
MATITARARGEVMTTPAEPETSDTNGTSDTSDTSERYTRIARRWFTEGWTGNLAMAGDIFSEDLRTNGVHVGVAGPVGRIREHRVPTGQRPRRLTAARAAG